MEVPLLLTRDGAVGIITMNCPDKLNALDLSMRAAIAGAVNDFNSNDEIRAIVVTGGEKVFAAGADLNLLVDKGPRDIENLNLPQYWEPLVRCPKPLIAAVSGYALGAGCEMAMMCDFIVCDATARFGQTEAKVGIMPGAGGTQRLVRAVGKSVASLMLLTGHVISGERAYELGLVADLVADRSALSRAVELGRAAAVMPPMALRSIKRTLETGANLPLDAALDLENREFLLLFDTEDKSEGMRAFLEKRSPQFKGR